MTSKEEPTEVYTGSMHKVEDAEGNWVVAAQSTTTMSSVVPGAPTTTQVVTFLDKRVYMQMFDEAGSMIDSQCYPQEQIPPYDDLKEAFEHAASPPEGHAIADYAVADCAQHRSSTVSVAWAGQTYVFCQVSPNSLAEFIGEGFVMDVTNFNLDVEDAAPWTVPNDMDGNPLNCPQVDATAAGTVNEVPTTRRRLLEGEAIDAKGTQHMQYRAPWWAKLHPEEDSLDSRREHLRRLSNGKTCLFVHGMGNENAGPLTSTFTSYWGNVHTKVSTCSDIKFMHLDTVNNEWDSPTLHAAFCAAADPNGDGSITDTIVFSHSMGVLLVGSALANADAGRANGCSLGSGSTWYPVSGPTLGSPAADTATALCSSSATGWLVELMGYCTSDSGTRVVTPAVGSLAPAYVSTPSYSEVSAALNTHASGAMCGTSAWGLTTFMSPAMAAVKAAVNGWRSGDVDGLVSGMSCQASATGQRWDNAYTDSWFNADLNHLDTTCRNKDGWWGDDRKACSWYEEHV